MLRLGADDDDIHSGTVEVSVLLLTASHDGCTHTLHTVKQGLDTRWKSSFALCLSDR